MALRSLLGCAFGDNKFLGEVIVRKGKEMIDGSVKFSYNVFLSVIKKKVKDIGYDANLYGTHSCRSGAATKLAPSVTPFELQLSGRWADARSIRNYVEVDRKRRFDISRHLFI